METHSVVQTVRYVVQVRAKGEWKDWTDIQHPDGFQDIDEANSARDHRSWWGDWARVVRRTVVDEPVF